MAVSLAHDPLEMARYAARVLYPWSDGWRIASTDLTGLSGPAGQTCVPDPVSGPTPDLGEP